MSPTIVATFLQPPRRSPGSLAKFAAKRRASSRVSRLVAERRCRSSSSRFYYDTILRQFNVPARRVMQCEIRGRRVRLRFSRLGFALFAAALVLASPARADLVITVDKSAQQMTVADDGTVLYNWPVSTGMADYDTPTGEFKPFRMERDHFSREWDDAPMPYSIFFTQEGHAIHGSYDIKHLGRPASHGCVRLSHPHAATLFSLVQQEGISNTRVVLTGEIPDAESHRYDKSTTSEMGSLYPTTPNVGSPEWKQDQALAKFAAIRRASWLVSRLVAERRCGAPICPQMGDKRKSLAHARNDVNDPSLPSAAKICCDAQCGGHSAI